MDSNEQNISIQALRQGNRQEFARLVDLYSGQLYRLALKMLGDPQDAEDVLQNTFLKALQNIETFKGRSTLSTWLYRIAANEALMLLRRKKPEVALSDAAVEDENGDEYMPMEFTDWCCLPEEEFISAEAARILNEAVDRLPPTLRVVFLLRDIEGLSIQETGEALGLSETAVKTRLLRARLRLRDLLSAYYAERLSGKEAVK